MGLPPKPLASMALGSRIPTLLEDYKIGRLCGRYFLATVGKLLAATPPMARHLTPVAPTLVVPPATVANDVAVTPIVEAPEANDAAFNNEDLA